MPQSLVTIQPNTWTLLTSSNVTTNVTFQCPHDNPFPVLLMGTVGAVAPTSTDGALEYKPGQGEMNVLIAEMFPDVSGANRIYGFCRVHGSVVVSHA